MFAAVTSVALVGVRPRPVRVEVHIGGSTPSFALVGLPDTAVREAKERVRSAVVSSGFEFPNRRLTVNLSPADLPKVGAAYDLPIALGILAAARVVPAAVADVVALGELALDGGVRGGVDGLGAALIARDRDVRALVPAGSAGSTGGIGADVAGVRSLAHAVSVALGEDQGEGLDGAGSPTPPAHPDLAAVKGQPVARRALEIAAAGRHHLLMVGPPGGGKTLLARCLPGILPPLDDDAALEAACVWAAAGRERGLSSTPPFAAPHHRTSAAGLVGGGSRLARPGALSLAHRGVLFLDELGEFPPHLLDALRQPLERGEVEIGRAGGTVVFPASVQLVAASNPCPCGHLGDPKTACRCRPSAVGRYRRRMSGPFLDRFDLRITVPRVRLDTLHTEAEGSAPVRRRVAAAAEWLAGEPGTLDAAARRLLTSAGERLALTARGAARVSAVARTIAALGGRRDAGEADVAEALALRSDP